MKKKTTLALALMFWISINHFAFGQTTIILQPDGIQGKDAQVWSNGADINIGNHQSLTAYAWTNGGNPGRKRILIDFDLSQIPANAEIISAKLSLYYNPNDDIEGFSEHTGNNKALLRRLVQDWDESSVTWNTLPASTSQGQMQLQSSSSGTQDYTNIDVTSLVQDMIDDPMGSYGFLLRIKREQPYKSVIFASSDHADASNHPKLEVTYALNISEKAKVESMPDIQIFPNPAAQVLYVNCEKFQSDRVSVTINDEAGRRVYSTEINSNPNEQISLEKIPAGFYFITFYDQFTRITKKICVVE